MSTPEYFAAMAARANAVIACSEIQLLNIDVNVTVSDTLAAIAAQISAIEAQALLLFNDISTLTALIATMTATQTATASIGVVSATAAAVSDLGSAIAYIKAQGLILTGFSVAGESTFIAQALNLAKALLKIQSDYDILENKISTLNAQVSTIPTELAALQVTMNTAALRFPSCTL
jgi:hypothetical protein